MDTPSAIAANIIWSNFETPKIYDSEQWGALPPGAIVKAQPNFDPLDAEPWGLIAPDLPRYYRKVAPSADLEWGRYQAGLHVLSKVTRSKKPALSLALEQWYILRANSEPADQVLEPLLGADAPEHARALRQVEPRAVKLALGHHKGKTHLYAQDHKGAIISISESRYDALVAAGANGPVIRLMLLRYAAVFSNRRQFATNPSLIQDAADHGVDIEGFASPFNVQLLLINSRAKFCSMYLDTDAPFGSLGSFFGQNFEGQKVFLNPPSNETLLNRTLEFCAEQLLSHGCTFYILLPAWEDLPAWKAAQSSRYMISHRKINMGEHPSINPYDGQAFPSSKMFDLFVLSSE